MYFAKWLSGKEHLNLAMLLLRPRRWWKHGPFKEWRRLELLLVEQSRRLRLVAEDQYLFSPVHHLGPPCQRLATPLLPFPFTLDRELPHLG